MRRISIVIAGLLLVVAGAAHAATLWQSGTYAYDGQGNIRAIGSDFFYYDSLGRLRHGDAGPGRKQEYTYDDYGNLTSVKTDGSTENVLGVNPSTNRLTDTTKNVFGMYDSEGNMLSYIGLDTFSYDRLGSTTRSKVDGVEKIHIYTASDERIASITVGSNGVATRSEVTLRDPSARVLRRYATNGGLSGSWTWEQDYVYRGGALLAAELPTGRRQFHPDHLGTPRLITDGSGATVSLHTYYPFGAEVTASQQERLKFTGHERDNPNLDSMHARYYRPMAGRFLSVDPVLDIKEALHEPQLWNRYSYVTNNPLKFTDPDGRYRTFYKEKPMTAENLAMDENTPAVVRYSMYATGGLTALGTGGLFFGGGGLASGAFRLAPVARGNYIETALATAFGGGLPRTFPVIDRFLNGVATSVKSLDLLSKTYQNASRLTSTLTGFVDKLAQFNGARLGNVQVQGNAITQRVLEVVVQRGAATPEQMAAIQRAAVYAKEHDVTLKVIMVK